MGSQFVNLDLAKLADVADTFAFEGGEVGGDATGFEIDDTSEGFVEERTDRLDWEAAGFGLELGQRSRHLHL